MHTALHLLYGHECCTAKAHTHLSINPHQLGTPLHLGEGKGVRDAFAAAAKHIFALQKFEAANMQDEPVKGLLTATYTALKQAVNTGITQGGSITAETLKRLQTDVYVFSGMKTYVQLKETAALLVSEDGKGIRTFESFKTEVQKINATYNTRYLRTEYQYAATTAQNAARWQKYEAQKERYHLRYLTDNGPNVREAHRALEGTVLPVDDPFWNQYLPKNGWNCHCFVVQVKIGELPVSDSEAAQKLGDKATTQLTKDGKNAGAIFRYNAGKDKVIFPPKHPYTLTRCGNKLTAADDDKCQAKKVVEDQAKEEMKKLLAEQRTAIKEWAKDNLVGKQVTHEALSKPITFSMNGIKETLNQGHEFVVSKNEALKTIEKLLPEGKYAGSAPDTKGRGLIFHYIEILISGSPSYAVIKETLNEGFIFYSIVDKIKK